MARDDLPVRQLGMERTDDCGSVSVPVGDRSVLQGDQADPPTGRLPGHNANAVRWQVWTALLTYLLLRFLCLDQSGVIAFCFFTLIRSAMWMKLELRGFLESYGTAGGSFRFLGAPEQAYLPGIL